MTTTKTAAARILRKMMTESPTRMETPRDWARRLWGEGVRIKWVSVRRVLDELVAEGFAARMNTLTAGRIYGLA